MAGIHRILVLAQFRKSFLTAGIFVRRAYRSLEAVPTRDYRSRRGDGVKCLVEEVIPLTALLKHLEVPSRDVRCRLAPANANHDAQIRLCGPDVERGFLHDRYYVEVTTAASPLDYLRREALNANGFVYGGPGIRREGSRARGTARVVSKAVAVTGTAAATEITEWVQRAIELKASKDYPSPCILLINAEPDKALTLAEWAALAHNVHAAASKSGFAAVYVVHWGRSVAFSVHAS